MVGAPPPLSCGNCGGAMQVLSLASHYGRTVEIDLCAPCHLVWFDAVESARLAGPGLLALIGHMAQAQALAHLPARPDMHCPHCQGALRRVHNRTRWGHSQQLECNQRHGSWQSFGQFLSEKGLLRAMSSADRARAHAGGATPACVNCGGALAQQDAACRWCQSVPALVDVARLARALDPQAATAGHAVHHSATTATALQCMACGAPQPADGGWACVQCRATLAMPGLAQAWQHVDQLGPALSAHARRPAPHVVKERLAAQEPALQRMRARAAAMQAEADQRMGRVAEPEEHRPELPGLGRLTGWSGGIVAVLVLLLWWWLS